MIFIDSIGGGWARDWFHDWHYRLDFLESTAIVILIGIAAWFICSLKLIFTLRCTFFIEVICENFSNFTYHSVIPGIRIVSSNVDLHPFADRVRLACWLWGRCSDKD